MAKDENKLFTVSKREMHFNFPIRVWVFRTRQAAREFSAQKRLRSKKYLYEIAPATWGPDN